MGNYNLFRINAELCYLVMKYCGGDRDNVRINCELLIKESLRKRCEALGDPTPEILMTTVEFDRYVELQNQIKGMKDLRSEEVKLAEIRKVTEEAELARLKAVRAEKQRIESEEDEAKAIKQREDDLRALKIYDRRRLDLDKEVSRIELEANYLEVNVEKIGVNFDAQLESEAILLRGIWDKEQEAIHEAEAIKEWEAKIAEAAKKPFPVDWAKNAPKPVNPKPWWNILD